MKDLIIQYLSRKLKEPSTWGGIMLWIAGQLHLQFSVDFNNILVQLGLNATSLALVLLNEGPKVARPIPPTEGK